ncbi:PREDICTED: protein unc-93 homolog A isoform X4 [Propithecus coquereli]|uniref:protein unc-93 homolog A isoform X4 n=1 Tax=Propithecus coquereli TaxID=379532 RepID=UPI00063FBD67|nr:PREDICTED: protein unc-93 homolog A isoform X4 [Propithecus coquereli]
MTNTSSSRDREHGTSRDRLFLMCTNWLLLGSNKFARPLAVGTGRGTMERSLRNVLVLSSGFLLLFTAYGGLQSLQSSLYSEEGLGVTALSALYGAVLLSSMFLPPLLIRSLGCKWAVAIPMCGYVAFSLGNFSASWYTLIPTSILLGLGAAPLWSAQCTYLTIVGNAHAEKAGKLGKDVVNQYFGIFFLIFQSSGVWGNLISSLVFGQTPSKDAIPEEQLASCGARDCLMATTPSNSTQRPSPELVYTLLGIYTGSGVLAILLIAVFLENIEDTQREGGGEKKSTPFWSTLLSTFKLFRDKRLRLLTLLPLYSGLQQGFLSGEYTRSYVTCALGIQFVGYVMICFSATNSLCSLLYGRISRHTGRIALYALGLLGTSLVQPPTQSAEQGQGSPVRRGMLEPGELSTACYLRRTRRPPSPATACGKRWDSSLPLGTARSSASTSSSMSSWGS